MTDPIKEQILINIYENRISELELILDATLKELQTLRKKVKRLK